MHGPAPQRRVSEQDVFWPTRSALRHLDRPRLLSEQVVASGVRRPAAAWPAGPPVAIDFRAGLVLFVGTIPLMSVDCHRSTRTGTDHLRRPDARRLGRRRWRCHSDAGAPGPCRADVARRHRRQLHDHGKLMFAFVMLWACSRSSVPHHLVGEPCRKRCRSISSGCTGRGIRSASWS